MFYLIEIHYWAFSRLRSWGLIKSWKLNGLQTGNLPRSGKIYFVFMAVK